MFERTVLSGIALVCGVAAIAPDAGAEASPVRLALIHSPGAESCLERTSLAQDVAARLHRDPFQDGALRSIEVVLARDGSGWVARIYARDEPGASPALRTLAFPSVSCDRIEASVALAVALAIDPDAPLGPVASPPPPSPPPASSAPPPPVSAPALAAPDAWDRRERFGIRAMGSLGTLPSFAGGAAITFDTRRIGALRASFGALRTGEVRTTDGAYGFSLTAFSAAACLGLANAYVAVSGCGGISGGVVTGVVHNLSLTPRDPGDYGWLALTLPGRFTWRLVDAVMVEIALEPYLALLRQQFEVAHVTATGPVLQTVFQQSLVGVNGYVGVSARF